MARLLGGESLYHIKQGMLAPVTLSSSKQIVYCKLPRHFAFLLDHQTVSKTILEQKCMIVVKTDKLCSQNP